MSEPLGIRDICAAALSLVNVDGPEVPDILPEHWYWCRVHVCPERSLDRCGGCNPSGPGDDNSWPDGPPYFDDACNVHGRHVRVGPFMSEAEANRLGGRQRGRNMDLDSDYEPLGLEVES